MLTREVEGKRAIQWIGVSNAGIIVVLTGGGKKLLSFGLDGKRLSTQELQLHNSLGAAAFSEDGRFLLLSAGEPRVIHVLNAETLERVQCIGATRTKLVVSNPDRQLACTDDPLGPIVRPSRTMVNSLRSVPPGTMQFPSNITSIAFSRSERHLLVGLANGKLAVLQLDAPLTAGRVVSRVIDIFTF